MLSADDMHQLTSMQWRQAGIQPNVVLTTSSIEAVRSLVGTGIGIAILPDMTYRPWSLDGDRVEMRPLGEPLPTVDVGLVWRKGSSVTDTARYFIELARDYSRTKTARASSGAPSRPRSVGRQSHLFFRSPRATTNIYLGSI